MTTPSEQPTQPIAPATDTASPTGTQAAFPAPDAPSQTSQPQPAPAGGTRPADRIYAAGVQQTFQAAHDLLTTGATFTIDNEDPHTGTIVFHDYDGARLTLTLLPDGTATQARLDVQGDRTGNRAREFYAGLDRQTSGAPAAGAAASRSGAAAAKKTSKLAVFAIIVAVFFLLFSFLGMDSWGMLVFFAILPALLSGFSVYVTRKDGKVQGRILAWVAVGITVVALIVGGVGIVRDGIEDKANEAELQASLKVTCKDYTWPTSDLVAQLPQPKSASGQINNESSSLFSVSVCDTDASQYAAYVSSVQEKGFTVDYTKTDTAFNAKNEEGYSVHVSVNEDNKNVMDISIYPPQDSTDQNTGAGNGTDEGSAANGTGQGSTGGTDSGADASAQPGTSDADFKAAMDSYEKTMNEYVDFMNKYNSEGKPVSMLADYTKWLQQYSDTMAKFDAVDDGSLTDEELQYYIEVQTRVNEKLATVAQ